MMNFIVIGICLLLLVLVVFISAKPISMGIEARRNLKDNENGIAAANASGAHLMKITDVQDVNYQNIKNRILELEG